MSENQYKEKLNELSRALLKLHRSLLQFQKSEHEQKEQKTITPYEALNLAINHPEFEWLRKISTAISDIDELTESKKEVVTEDALKSFKRRLMGLFESGPEHDNFRQRLNLAMAKDPDICIDAAAVRALLVQLPS